MTGFRERLARGDVLLGDGAWGTLLMARGLAPGEAPESWNVTHPDVIEAIAALYLEAGADIITTNTFGASPLKLVSSGLADLGDSINEAAVSLVRRAVGDRAFVSASIGPTGRLLLPFGDAAPAEMSEAFERQVAALNRAGVDLYCVETMSDANEAALAIAAIRAVAPSVPIVATMTFERSRRGFFTLMGVSVEAAAKRLAAAGADVVGSNCGTGIAEMVEIATEFRRHTDLPLAIQANAGLPMSTRGAVVYPDSPETMAARVPDLLASGVQIIGGCCGTTPDHIRALRAALGPAAL